MCCSVLQCVAVCCSVLSGGCDVVSDGRATLCYSTLQCVAECYRVLQSVGVCLQSVGVCGGCVFVDDCCVLHNHVINV